MIFLQAGTVLMFLEIAVFIVVGSHIGVLKTILLCALAAILGGAMVQSQGFSTLTKLQKSLDQGLMPVNEMFDGICLLMAGFLFILPGFVSDVIGFALLIPQVRHYLRDFLVRRYGMKGGDYDPDTGVIEGEFVRIRDDEDLIPPPAGHQ